MTQADAKNEFARWLSISSSGFAESSENLSCSGLTVRSESGLGLRSAASKALMWDLNSVSIRLYLHKTPFFSFKHGKKIMTYSLSWAACRAAFDLSRYKKVIKTLSWPEREAIKSSILPKRFATRASSRTGEICQPDLLQAL